VAAGVAPGAAAGALVVLVVPPEASGAAASITGTISGLPHDGHATQLESSMTLRQARQRFGANGSGCPQNGHALTALSMNLSQYGHGCLKVGIVFSC
jgi:hypothetical protein